MRIYKYELLIEKTQTIRMPKLIQILNIQMQNGIPVLWALVNPEGNDVEFEIHMYGTGWAIPDNKAIAGYLGSVQVNDFVWHYFVKYP